MSTLDHTNLRPTARAAAVEMIGMARRGATAGEAMRRSRVFAQLAGTRRKVAASIFLRSVDNRDQIREIIDGRVLRPCVGRRAVVDDILVAGIAELLSGRGAAPLIVASCVAHTRDLGFDGLSGLVNAVLRRVSDELAMRRAA